MDDCSEAEVIQGKCLFTKSQEVRKGLEIEREHSPTIRFIKDYVAEHKTFPADDLIFASIQKDHHAEDEFYYSHLVRMEAQAKAKNLLQKQAPEAINP